MIRAAIDDAKVALVNVRERELRGYGGKGYGWVLYQHELGPTLPALTRGLALRTYADADNLDDGEKAFRRLTGTPLWQNLPAVRADNVFYMLDIHSWLTMSTLADAGKVEDVRELPLGTP